MPVDERADGDSAGVYFISVEDFEARKPPPERKPLEQEPPGGALPEENG